VRAFLRAYGRTPQKLTVEQLEGWWFNVVLRIEADDERLVLRRYGVTPPEEVRWELAVLDHLQRHRFPAIAPLARSDVVDDRLGSFLGKAAILYPFVEGQRGCDIEWPLAVAQTCETVAQLHTLTEDLTVPYPRVRSGAESSRMVRGLMDLTAQRGVGENETGLRHLLARAERALEEFEVRVAPRAEGLRRAVVHHDAHCKNVLFRDDRLVALIDFDDAYEGYLVADLAVMIAKWAADRAPNDTLSFDRAVRVVHEYERHRPLTDTERELLPDFLLLFLLSDGAEYVRGQLERGADANAAVNDSRTYTRYVRHVEDGDWMEGFRAALWTISD
jgi:homoserine kinase type II